MYFCVLCIVCFVTFPVLFVCICVLNNCHQVAIQLQLNIYIISYHPKQKSVRYRDKCTYACIYSTPYFLSGFNENCSLEKFSNIKFHKNSFSGSRTVACGRTDPQTDKTNLIASFRNFANPPKNCIKFHNVLFQIHYYLFIIYLSLYLFIYLFIYLSVFIYLFIYLFTHFITHLPKLSAFQTAE